MPLARWKQAEILKQQQAGYVLVAIAAAHVGANRQTIYNWAQAKRVKSRKRMQFLFVFLDDCVQVAAGKGAAK